MNISNIFKQRKLVYSMEVFPPKKISSLDTVYNTLFGLRKLPVDYISVTYGAGGSDEQRGKTCEIASLIKSEYNIEPVSHLTCQGASKENIIESLEKLKENNITNILALRGDEIPGGQPSADFKYAADLSAFIKSYDSSFNILGACYPECHPQCHSLDEDIDHLKKKIDCGVSALITQLFFDNDSFYTFMDKIVQKGITVPVEAGIMPISNKSQIERMVSMCGASLPNKLTKMISKYANDPIALCDAGIAYATEQIVDLITNDIAGIHLYTMNNVKIAEQITFNIKNILDSCNKQ